MKKNLQTTSPNTLNQDAANPRVQGNMNGNAAIELVSGLLFYTIAWIAITFAGASILIAISKGLMQ